MKAIKTPLIITSIRSKKDKSLSFSATTPELQSEEAVEFMHLQGINLEALLNPIDHELTEEIKVKSDLDVKTPSQRLRSSLYVYFKKLEENGNDVGDFADFYHRRMEKLIEFIKTKIDEI